MAKKGNQKNEAAHRTMAEKAMIDKAAAGKTAVPKEKRTEQTGARPEDREERDGEKTKAKSWKVDFIMGIVIAVIGLPFFVTEYRIAGIAMAVIGGFCVVSGLCQKAAKDGKG